MGKIKADTEHLALRSVLSPIFTKNELEFILDNLTTTKSYSHVRVPCEKGYGHGYIYMTVPGKVDPKGGLQTQFVYAFDKPRKWIRYTGNLHGWVHMETLLLVYFGNPVWAKQEHARTGDCLMIYQV